MPTYNRAAFIESALDSIGEQTARPFEVVVVDDGSTDDTESRVLRHPLADVIRYERHGNRGASVSRNRGVALARGEIIVFLDSDDILEPDHHATVLDVMTRPTGVALLCCDCRMIGPSGEAISTHSYTDVQCAIKGVQIRSGSRTLADVFLFSTPFPGMAVWREVYCELGGLDQELFPLDDFDLQLKVAASGRAVHYEHRPLARYRIHGANESGPGRAVRVGEKKLLCIQRARARYPALGALRWRGVRRVGEVRRELALARLKEGELARGALSLLRSLVEDPVGGPELLQHLLRRYRRWTGAT